MISIIYDKKFKKHYKERIKNKRKLLELFNKNFSLFLQYPYHPDLKNHELEKQKKDLRGYRSFSIDDDCRVLYKEDLNCFYILDIGTHKQIYE